MDMALIDETGKLAPLALHAPPHHCERSCDEPPLSGCSPGGEPAPIAPGGSWSIPWDGSIRKFRMMKGELCYDRSPAPDGVYLLRVCAEDGRCGLARFEMPRAAPVEVALRPRDDVRRTCDRTTIRRGLALALGNARKAGLTEEHLAGCAALDPPCEGPELTSEPGPCRARITAGSGRWEVDLRLPPRDGAPLRYGVWIDADAVGTGNIFREGSTWAVLDDLWLRGEPTHIIHEHGGEAAKISSAEMHIYNRGDRPRTLSLRGATWITNYRTTPLENISFLLEGQPQSAEITVAPRSDKRVWLSFSPQRAYQSWNDHFYAAAEIAVDGVILRPQTEFHVTRIDVLHR